MGAAAAPLQAGLWLLWQGDYHNDILRRLVGRDGGRGLGRKEKRKERGRDKRGSASGAWVRRGPEREACPLPLITGPSSPGSGTPKQLAAPGRMCAGGGAGGVRGPVPVTSHHWAAGGLNLNPGHQQNNRPCAQPQLRARWRTCSGGTPR